MEKNSAKLKDKTDKLSFDMLYGKYLQEKYPDLYLQGIKIAVEKYHHHPNSIAAFLFASDFVEGFLSTTGIAKLIHPKNIH